MLHLVIGIAIILAPFTAVFFYSNLKEGLLKMGLYTAFFHLLVSIITQGFHIFNYPVVATVHTIFAILLIDGVYLHRKKASLRGIQIALKENWIFCIAIVVIFAQLFSVHYAYTGIVQTLRGQTHVVHSDYPYPFVSDEWVTVSLVNYSISHNALPLVNPLNHNLPFSNLLFVFSSVLAELFLITGLNAVLAYSAFAIIFGLLLCSSFYILLKRYGTSSPIATAAMLCIPYIANSGNLSAVWALLPFTIGTIFLLWQLTAQRSPEVRHASVYAIGYMLLALLVYPPMVIFCVPALLFSMLRVNSTARYSTVLMVCAGITVTAGAAVLVFFLGIVPFHISILDMLHTYIIRPNLDSGIVSYAIWNVLPVVSILFALLGIYRAARKSYYDILLISGVGLLYWLVYAFVNKVFIIEYPRIAVITSILLLILAGIGCEWFVEFITDKSKKWRKIFLVLGIGILGIVISIVLLPSYTSREVSNNFPVRLTDESGTTKSFTPTTAVNRYLTLDDLRLFRGIVGQTFVAPPWKGLILSVITSNTALETKASTISNNFFSYSQFVSLDCEGKNKAADYYRIGYAYSDTFSCPNFHEVGSSTEGLYLYRYSK